MTLAMRMLGIVSLRMTMRMVVPCQRGRIERATVRSGMPVGRRVVVTLRQRSVCVLRGMMGMPGGRRGCVFQPVQLADVIQCRAHDHAQHQQHEHAGAQHGQRGRGA